MEDTENRKNFHFFLLQKRLLYLLDFQNFILFNNSNYCKYPKVADS
jgi:hypothetical protein